VTIVLVAARVLAYRAGPVITQNAVPEREPEIRDT
jgi:hypothetical protein